MKVAFFLAATALAAGCLGDGPLEWPDIRPEDFPDDMDLDGIPDALERALGSACRLAGVACADAGIAPPQPGVRDYIVAQYGRSGEGQDWRVEAGVWEDVIEELAGHGIRLQVAELGLRDDVGPEATWDDPAWAERYWFTWLRYEPPDEPDSLGYSEWNLIAMQIDPIEERWLRDEQTITLLHEIYHSMLGFLEGNRSRCDDPEVGGPQHSSDAGSILYADEDCDQQENGTWSLGPVEAWELSLRPFENLAIMNSPAWWT